MTPTQYKLWKFVRAYIGEHGFSPTYEEIRIELALASKSGVVRLVDGLVNQGKIRRDRRRHRNLETIGGEQLAPGMADRLSKAIEFEAMVEGVVYSADMRKVVWAAMKTVGIQ